MHVSEYDADDEELVEAGRFVHNAVLAIDAPWMPQVTAHRWRMQVRYGWDQSPERHVLLTVDGEPAAVADVELGEWDNRDLAWIHLLVHPGHRRRGVGSALLEEIRGIARVAGRTKIGGSWWQTAATEAFAAHHGFRLASREVYRRVTLAELPAGLADTAYDEAEAHAGDYELVRVEGRAPDELLPGIAQLTAAINDAPLDDLDIEDEVFPVQRIRDYEEATTESGHRLRRVVVRHRETGELAGHTLVAVDVESPDLAHQHDTAVVRAHRGHRLGLLLKADMLRWLASAEPQVVSVDTWNAESNDRMIAVNQRLGYRALGCDLAFQGRLSEVASS
jgi:GNAT superfamily N-acetyltransferase